MGGSWRSSNRAALWALALGACVSHEAGIEGTQSLRVEILAPADLGTEANPLDTTDRTVMIRVTAIDAQGAQDATFDAPEVDVYSQFLGTLTPEHSLTDPQTDFHVAMSGGQGTATLDVAGNAFGPTILWVEDVRTIAGRPPTYATGTSPTIHYRNPFLDDVSRPPDEMALNALEISPLEGKQIRVDHSRFGATGTLVATGVYTQGYTLSDANCTANPCLTTDYGHIFVFTFGRPRAEDGTAIEIGSLISYASGGVGEFNGYTELNFPQSGLVQGAPDESKVPKPVVIQGAWLTSSAQQLNLEKVESGLVEVDNGSVCPLDDDFTTYMQWKLDVGNGCGKPINVISAGTANAFDPGTHVAQTIPRVVGTLKAVNIGSFSVWIILPRRDSDIVTN